MITIHQVAPADARTIHYFIIINTTNNVKLYLGTATQFLLAAHQGSALDKLSRLDKRNTAVNCCDSQ
jgi:hypothetical protein